MFKIKIKKIKDILAKYLNYDQTKINDFIERKFNLTNRIVEKLENNNIVICYETFDRIQVIGILRQWIRMEIYENINKLNEYLCHCKKEELNENLEKYKLLIESLNDLNEFNNINRQLKYAVIEENIIIKQQFRKRSLKMKALKKQNTNIIRRNKND